jgi:phage N-6-adenine-methyltransferase
VDSNSYETPKYFFDLLDLDYSFNYDLACTEKNKKAKFLQDDTLKYPWHTLAGWQWLNPPYKPLKPWIIKSYEESKKGANIVMLVPLTTLANDYYCKHPADDFYIVSKRLFFEYEGKICGGNRHNSVVLIYSPEVSESNFVKYIKAR